MKLRDLEASFMAHEARAPNAESRALNPQWSPDYRQDWFITVDTFAEAHGLKFLCPKSFAANGGAKGAHFIIVWFSGKPVPPHIGRNKAGKIVRWQASGTSLDDLILTPSIQEEDDLCKWHGFVGSGGIPQGEAA